MRISRGFSSALGGFAMTLFAWFGPWAWPAWPAFSAIGLLFGKGGFAELQPVPKAAALVGLIVLNSGFWAIIIRLVLELSRVVRRKVFGPAVS